MEANTLIKLVKHRAVDDNVADYVASGLSRAKWSRFCSGHSLEGANAATLLTTARTFEPRVLALRDKAGRLLPLPDSELESALTRLSEADEILWHQTTFTGRCG